MRIGAFELECSFYSSFVLAQVINGQAFLLRSIYIRNIRGNKNDWLKLSIQIGDKLIRQKAVRHLSVGDEETAFCLEQDILHSFAVPEAFGAGSYSASLAIDEENGRCEIPFSFEVLSADLIPTDFARSIFLASYLHEGDSLRAFADASVSGMTSLDAVSTLESLYNTVLEKQLHYQRPVTVRIPDCQRISDPTYVLTYGGSCADLALLFASLLWCRGFSPVLLLFPDHMAPGCFQDNSVPEFLSDQDPATILYMLETETLIILESTCVCSSHPEPYSQAKEKIKQRLKESNGPCQLLNLRQILRTGIRLLPEKSAELKSCKSCGYPRVSLSDYQTGYCPACGEVLADKITAPSVSEAVIEFAGPDPIRYRCSGNYAIVDKITNPRVTQIRIRGTWQGIPVRLLGERALVGSLAEKVWLPDVLTQIDDYAFYRCSHLKQISLPDSLRVIGAGAFCGSALRSITIPTAIRKIQRLTFSGCQFLEEAILPEGLEEIEERAFAQCPKLRRIQIPMSVRSIGRNAFDPSCELWLMSSNTRIEQ